MIPSGYRTRFVFEFFSDNGAENVIKIQQRGYEGAAKSRALGRAPILRRENGESGVLGTSLEIFAQCDIDSEYAELYTTDAREYLVTYERNGALVWVGFASPELYSAPDIAPPYDVTITATDGLGELKEATFASLGRASLQDHLLALLEHTGLDINLDDIVIVSSLAVVQPTIAASALMDSLYLDAAHLEGETCYDALVAILGSFGFKITQQGAKWVLLRENDATLAEGAVAAEDASGLPVSLLAPEIGSMTETDWWPIGQTSTVVEPARRVVSVVLPYYKRRSLFDDPDLRDSSKWQHTAGELYVHWQLFANGEWRPVLYAKDQSVYIEQDGVQVEETSDLLNLSISTLGTDSSIAYSEYYVYLQLTLRTAAKTYYLKRANNGEMSWVERSETIKLKVQQNKALAHMTATSILVDNFTESTLEVPGLPASGTLGVRIEAHTSYLRDDMFVVGRVYLSEVISAGYKDVVTLDNNARGSEAESKLSFGDAVGMDNKLATVSNALSYQYGQATALWRTSRISTPAELIRVMALEAAMAVALPRFRVRGAINVPSGAVVPMFAVSQDQMLSIVQEVEWDLVSDSAEIRLLSVSVAAVEVASEEMGQLTEAEAQAVTGGQGGSAAGGGGSGGTVRSVGLTMPDAFEVEGSPVTSSGVMDVRLKDSYEIPSKEVMDALRLLASFFAEDENGDIYVKRKDDNSARNFYAFGGVSSGGKSSGGGGGGSEAVRIDAFDIPQGTTTFTTLDKARGSWTNDKLVCTLYNHLNEVCIADIKINTSGAAKYITVGFAEPILSPMRLVVFADNN